MQRRDGRVIPFFPFFPLFFRHYIAAGLALKAIACSAPSRLFLCTRDFFAHVRLPFFAFFLPVSNTLRLFVFCRKRIVRGTDVLSSKNETYGSRLLYQRTTIEKYRAYERSGKARIRLCSRYSIQLQSFKNAN